MPNLIMWNLISLDGFFEGAKPWDLDWHNSIWGPEMDAYSLAQLKTAGMLLFGRVTYQGMAAYWSTAKGEVADLMNDLPKAVFSRTLTQAEWKNTRLVKSDAARAVATLKEQPGKGLFIFGSASLCTALIQEGLIDELRICVTPLLLGNGTPLFKPGGKRMDLTLLETQPIGRGGVLFRYQVQRQ
jgi:dihydrofolate reductase